MFSFDHSGKVSSFPYLGKSQLDTGASEILIPAVGTFEDITLTFRMTSSAVGEEQDRSFFLVSCTVHLQGWGYIHWAQVRAPGAKGKLKSEINGKGNPRILLSSFRQIYVR